MKQRLLEYLSKISFINNFYSGIATIFLLHRVSDIDKNRLYPNENMKVSPSFLEEFIKSLKKSNKYEFISLDELHKILINEKKVGKKHYVLFTLDDGYKDNYQIAYPIFKHYNIPFTIYITTSFPNKKAILWWYIIENLIIQNDEIRICDKRFECRTYEEKNKVFFKLREIIINMNQKNLLFELNKLFQNYNINWYSMNEDLCISWDEIKELSQDELCTIGNHTENHYNFKYLSETEIINEIVNASNELESRIRKKIEHFAYPFGSSNEIGKREAEIVSRLNFKTVVTTRRGTIYYKHKNYLNCCLPRVTLTNDFNIKSIGRIRKRRVVTL
jgi:peptidoglycan/xylan/chitin deacetylase (PgdA/CDA1 family)